MRGRARARRPGAPNSPKLSPSPAIICRSISSRSNRRPSSAPPNGEAGLRAYEISNHARPGGESRHNLTYWRYGDYVGIGPGAHGRLTIAGEKFATRQHRAPEAWLAAVEAAGHATRQRDPVAPADRLNELVMMGLRTVEGVRRSRVVAEYGRPLEAVIDP